MVERRFFTLSDGRIVGMPQRIFLFAQLVVVSILAAFHTYAMTHFYYWIYPWFDIPMHLLAGVWAGFFAAWILTLWGKAPALIFCVAVVLAIGIGWEAFEAVTGLTQFPADTLDTIKDLSMDVAGGIAAALFARYFARP